MLSSKELAERFFSHFCEVAQKDIAIRFGVRQSVVSEWKAGKRRIPWSALVQLAKEEGISLDWLITGKEMIRSNTPMSAKELARIINEMPKLGGFTVVPTVRVREPISFTLNAEAIPVVGEAAADETEGSRAGFFPPDPEARYDEIHPPETTAAVRIIGNSMSPVLLDGQYAIIGPEYFGSVHPGNYDIVVADVEIRDEEQAGSDARWTGLYCKRIVDAGDVWVFLSINQTGTPFSVAKANCRLWPVIGVWFAGRGRPPEE